MGVAVSRCWLPTSDAKADVDVTLSNPLHDSDDQLHRGADLSSQSSLALGRVRAHSLDAESDELSPADQADGSQSPGGPLDGSASNLSARHLQWQQRKQARQQRRKQKSTGGTVQFLSNVPEVEADVQYRFNFVVIGPDAAVVTNNACGCKESRSVGTVDAAEDLGLGNQNVHGESVKASHSHPTDRCLCPVPYPWGRSHSSDRLKLAKIGFAPRKFFETLPECRSRLESLNTAMIFVLTVDAEGAENSFASQLENVTLIVQQLKLCTRTYLRPVRAILLVRRADLNVIPGGIKGGPEPWVAVLEEFERTSKAQWKFGPISIHDDDGIYAIFAKIASQRIYQNQSSKEDGQSGADHPHTSNGTMEENEENNPQPSILEETEDETMCWGVERSQGGHSDSEEG